MNQSHKYKNHKAIVAILFISIIALTGCSYKVFMPEENVEKPNTNTNAISFKEIPTFKDENEMLAYFEQSRSGNYGAGGILRDFTSLPTMATGATNTAAESDSSQKSFSTTNVQIEGVDEADIVKTDGKYIYVFSKNKIVIVDAYPAQDGKVISSIDMNNISPTEMFVEGTKLIVFGFENNYEYYDAYAGKTSGSGSAAVSMPSRPGTDYYYPYTTQRATVTVYDISDKQNPVREKHLEFEGSYLTSRLVDGKVIFVINSYPNYYYAAENYDIIPLMQIDGVDQKIASPSQIGYIYPTPAHSFVTIASIDIRTYELSKQTIAGSAQNIFASLQNIYLSSTSYLPPQTPIIKDAQRAIYGDTESTIINKFSFADGNVGFLGQGIVRGHVLNQFSMDEFEENLRVATTSGNNWDQLNPSMNNMYVLDKEMKQIGKLEGLAPGESIYSARFMGKRAYMVTFKKVDPLFVIDLANPFEPKVLGKLKIPGYSDYLHPIDENHIIGIGKDTIESEYGNFAWYQGMKMAIFDVTNVENPKEMHKIIIGDRGTDSFALRNHKAFLYDKGKELLVLPIELHEILNKDQLETQTKDGTTTPAVISRASPEYGEATFQGAFVYKVTLENGFEERGRITHATEQDELMRGYYYYGDYLVQRSLYIEDVLYTISQRMIKANDLSSLENISEFLLE